MNKYFAEIDGFRYPKEIVLRNFTENDYLDQNGDLILFYKEYVGKESVILFISYTDMKNNYPIKVIDLWHQVDHITPKEIILFEEYKKDPVYPIIRLYIIIIKHRRIEMIWDG